MPVLLSGSFGQMFGLNCSFAVHLGFQVQMVGHWLFRQVATWVYVHVTPGVPACKR